jgi:hypothetical protein
MMKLSIRDNNKVLFEKTSLHPLDFATDRAYQELMNCGVENPTEEEVRQHIERSPKVYQVQLEAPEDPFFNNDYNSPVDPYAASPEVVTPEPEGLESPYDPQKTNPYAASLRFISKDGGLVIKLVTPEDPSKNHEGNAEAVRVILSRTATASLDTIKVGNRTLRDMVRRHTMSALIRNEHYELRQAAFELRQQLKAKLESLDSKDIVAFTATYGDKDYINFSHLLTNGIINYKLERNFNLKLPGKG